MYDEPQSRSRLSSVRDAKTIIAAENAVLTASHLLSPMLQVITRAISTFVIKRAGFIHAKARTGTVTLIQRFGSAANLNIIADAKIEGIASTDLAGPKRVVYCWCMARTNVDIDDKACAIVMRRYQLATKRDAINFALRTLAAEPLGLDEARKLRGSGWIGDLDEMRTHRNS